MGLSEDEGRKQRDITVRVDDIRMSIRIPVGEEETELHLRSAAKMVNDLISRYRLRFPHSSREEILAYVALHSARDFCELDFDDRSRQNEQRLSALLKSLDEALS